jgi:phospholipid/cholesterol/gamma-HCH transport system ATP-binding protein
MANKSPLPTPTPAITIENLTTRYGNQTIHNHLSCTIWEKEIFAIVGGSGSGKSTLLKAIIGLMPIAKGSVRILNLPLSDSPQVMQTIYHQIGFLFQEGALFAGLDVLGNIAYPMIQLAGIDPKTAHGIARMKLSMVGLPAQTENLFPDALSGGMRKRVALARAIAMDPKIVFLDEPTAGLDPQASDGFDSLILALQASLGLTVVMVTHDLSTLARVPHRLGFITQGRMITGSVQELLKSDQEEVRTYFHGPRAQEIFHSSPL